MRSELAGRSRSEVSARLCGALLAWTVALFLASAGLALAAIYVDAHYDGARWRTSREIAEEAAWQSLLRDTPEDALAKIEAYLVDYPSDISLRLKAGELAERLKRHAASVAHFQEVRRLDPGNAEAAKGLARGYAALGQDDLAVFQWEEAARLLPKDAAVHRELGLALKKKGDTLRAMESIQQSLLLDPSQQDLHAILSELAMAKDPRGLPDDGEKTPGMNDEEGLGRPRFDLLGLALPGDVPRPIDPSRYMLESVRGNPRTSVSGLAPRYPRNPKPQF